jgi:calmodulin
MKAAFNLFDQDGDGYITSDQLQEILKTLGKATTPQEIRELIGGNVEGLFTQRDGKIDYDTFVEIFVRAILLTDNLWHPWCPGLL